MPCPTIYYTCLTRATTPHYSHFRYTTNSLPSTCFRFQGTSSFEACQQKNLGHFHHISSTHVRTTTVTHTRTHGKYNPRGRNRCYIRPEMPLLCEKEDRVQTDKTLYQYPPHGHTTPTNTNSCRVRQFCFQRSPSYTAVPLGRETDTGPRLLSYAPGCWLLFCISNQPTPPDFSESQNLLGRLVFGIITSQDSRVIEVRLISSQNMFSIIGSGMFVSPSLVYTSGVCLHTHKSSSLKSLYIQADFHNQLLL